MAQIKAQIKETRQMSHKIQPTYQAAYDELFMPAMGALRGIRLDSRQHHTVAGLLAEVAGRAAEQISRKS